MPSHMPNKTQKGHQTPLRLFREFFYEARKQYFATVTTTGADNKASQSGCVFVVTLSWSLDIRSVVWDLISGINHHLWSSCLLDQNSVIDKNLHAPNLSRSRSLILKQKKTELPNTHEKRMVESRETSQHVSQISKTKNKSDEGNKENKLRRTGLSVAF